MAIGHTHWLRVTLKGRQGASDYRNVLNFGTNVAVHDGNRNALLLALATAVAECFITHLLPILSSNFTDFRVSAREVWPMASDEVEYVPDIAEQVGAVAGDRLPSFNSMLLSFKTGKAGASKRGRMFLPSVPEGGVSNDTLSPATQAALIAFAACLVGKYVGAAKTEDETLLVVSQKLVGSNPPNYGNATSENVASILVRPDVAIMGRRKINRGS